MRACAGYYCFKSTLTFTRILFRKRTIKSKKKKKIENMPRVSTAVGHEKARVIISESLSRSRYKRRRSRRSFEYVVVCACKLDEYATSKCQ